MSETKGVVQHPALTDLQTGLPNRLHWDTVFGVIFAAGDRGIPLTVILVEVDHFQAWHRNADPADLSRALRAMGSALSATTRGTDLVARVEEERFAFLLLDCNMAGGRLVADRVDGLLDPFREMTGLSISMGVAVYNRDMARHEDLLGAANKALRAAQAQGGNQIEFHS
jgi:diguanylate cyclase (GGDEF)-like protein